MSKQGYCKFCGKYTKLVKSHIIPKFLYTDSNNSKKKVSVDTKTKKTTLYQAGIWDNILCEDCERLTAIYDNEFLNFINLDFNKFIFSKSDNEIIYKISSDNYNYQNLRKFFISILLRCSISKKNEFDLVNLGKYEKVALDILNDKYDNENFFATLIFREPNSKMSKDLNFIERTKYENQIAYKIYFGGFQINIIVNIESIRKGKIIPRLICNQKENIFVLESQELLDYKINHIANYYKYYKSICKKI